MTPNAFSPGTESAPKKAKNDHMIALCSGTKGVGKTWLASTLCHALSLTRKKVLFFDADCGLENISSQLGIESTTPYLKLLSGGLTLNNAVTKFEKGRFDVICSKPGDTFLHTAPAGRVQIMTRDLTHLANFYDFVIIDFPNDSSTASNILLNACQTILIMANADPSSSTNAYKKLEELKKINAHSRLEMIINRALSHEEGKQIYKTLLQAAKEYINVEIGLFGIIRDDARIREAVLNQSLLLNRYPACEGAEDAVVVVRHLLEE